MGTQGVKALLYDTGSHTVVGRGAASYPLATPRTGAAEQDPEHWLQARLTHAQHAYLRPHDARRARNRAWRLPFGLRWRALT